MERYEFKCVRGHVEVYLDGVFLFSADSIGEAHQELTDAGDGAV